MTSNLNKIFADAFRHLAGYHQIPQIEVRFYPYAGLHHTIRLRSGRVYVRLSDICKDSSTDVLRALAFVLVARLLAKRTPQVHERTYRDYALKPDVQRASDIARRRRTARLRRQRLPGRKDGHAAFWVTMIESMTRSRSARHLTRLTFLSGLLNTFFITRCFTSNIRHA